MIINLTVAKDENGNDVFRLLTENQIDVDVTSEKGIEQLKEMFSELLKHMIQEEVEVEFIKTTGYDNKMYEEVCKSYVGVLNEELRQSREVLLGEGLCVDATAI